MNIRKATHQDVEVIGTLYQSLFSKMASLQPDFFIEAEQDKNFILKTIDDSTSDILVAVEDDRVLGFALVAEQDTPPYNCFIQKKIAYLMDLVVASESREKGVGTLLLSAVKEWARTRKLSDLELSVLSENKEAKNLYEKEGLEERIVTMGIRL